MESKKAKAIMRARLGYDSGSRCVCTYATYPRKFWKKRVLEEGGSGEGSREALMQDGSRFWNGAGELGVREEPRVRRERGTVRVNTFGADTRKLYARKTCVTRSARSTPQLPIQCSTSNSCPTSRHGGPIRTRVTR